MKLYQSSILHMCIDTAKSYRTLYPNDKEKNRIEFLGAVHGTFGVYSEPLYFRINAECIGFRFLPKSNKCSTKWCMSSVLSRASVHRYYTIPAFRRKCDCAEWYMHVVYICMAPMCIFIVSLIHICDHFYAQNKSLFVIFATQ